MNVPRLTIWQQWLLHALLLWTVSELNDALTYWYEVHSNGVYLINPDGSSVTQWQRFLNHNYYQAVWAVILAGTLPIEINYQLLFKKRPFVYFLFSISLCSIGFVALLTVYNRWKFGGQVSTLWAPAIIITGYSFAYALLRDFIQQRTTRAQQQIQHTQAELTALKAQINPHFFFNTLNTLYGTALLEKAQQTAQSIEQLASIMRYTITEAQQDFTPVAHEFTFITDYLQLQQLRLPQRDTIQIKTTLQYDDLPALIAPLLLIPFVENAFKYGIRMDHPCFITLQLVVQQQQLDLVIENSAFPLREDQAGLGTGIQNTRKRLDLLYPGNYQLTIQPNVDRYLVHLHLQLH
ncbi:histidine kinase [Spirosoma agri]|uniref:Histidine kinase n=1 Tax=Spirosoma agri TaxID=1987381 RepID=A0A6M0IQC3_9BACT|nr:sensor histidine kinase [Spirosoma agri]NEU70254.1 histidine kinase [Spirosoma agri]